MKRCRPIVAFPIGYLNALVTSPSGAQTATIGRHLYSRVLQRLYLNPRGGAPPVG